MVFALTREQEDIQKAAREFAEGEFRPLARALDAEERFDDRLWKKAAELGFLAVFIPEKYGGYGILEEYDVAHYWRNAKVLEIFEGSKEIEKLIIGRKVLGKA
jgi:alkylation response protein AidB-like acyl-CoA dehydrogenase